MAQMWQKLAEKLYEWLMCMLNSMTGFAAQTGAEGDWKWSWDIRSVNARGLDVRLRVPDWIQGLETELRTRVRARLARGSVTVSLRLLKDERQGADELSLTPELITGALDTLAMIEALAQDRSDLDLAPASAFDVFQMVRRARGDDDLSPEANKALAKTLLADFDAAFADFVRSRAAEGEKLAAVLQSQVARIDALTNDATQEASHRAAGMSENFTRAVQRMMENAETIDTDRVHQEIALMAVKADVTEELDRLRVHVAAAQDLLAANGAVGRKLDFLTQEFNREANTLCSKSQWPEITRIGLDLKAVVDQMREQVQNVE